MEEDVDEKKTTVKELIKQSYYKPIPSIPILGYDGKSINFSTFRRQFRAEQSLHEMKAKNSAAMNKFHIETTL